MKGKWYLLLVLVFGMMMGWALGFLRLPYLEKSYSFLLGFITALAFASLVLVLLTAWNRNFLPGLLGPKTATGDSKNTRTHAFIWIILLGVLVLGSVAGGVAVYRQQESFRLQVQKQDKRMQEMTARLAFAQKNTLEPLIHSILDDVREELKHNAARTLSDTLLARIAAVSLSFQPYPYMENDTLSKQRYSPERGQLLQALILMNIDSGSFGRIKRNTLFAGADLQGRDLKGLDLSGLHLQEANLKGANLGEANLTGCNFEGANFWGAHLDRAKLSNANLKNANLSWAQLNETTLSLANLNGANLNNAQLRKADLTGATLQFAQSVGTLFNEANLTSVDFLGTNLTKVNLTQATMNYVNLRKTNLTAADLVGVTLSKAMVEENWVDQLKEWQPTGAKEILENYTVVNDTADKFKTPRFRLTKK